MRHEFKLQDPGEGVHEAEINEVLVNEGDRVAEGDDVLVVESDKAAIELPSPYSGRVAEIRVSAGDVVEVGDILMVFEDEDEDEHRAQEDGKKKDWEQKDKAESRNAKERKQEERRPKEEGKNAGDQDGKVGDDETDRPIKASPAARKLAEKESIDISEVSASGNAGQVTVDDVREAATADDKAASTEKEPADKEGRETEESAKAEAEKEAMRGKTAHDSFGPVERVPLGSVRSATARAMAYSWAAVPKVTHQDEADITELELWRREIVAKGEAPKLSLTAIAAKAVAAVLKEHPRFNARFDADKKEIILCHYCNMNIAVATERGLLTPVVMHVDTAPLREIAVRIDELATRARKGRASKEDLSGGTFTITNVGGLGGTSFSPLINPPQTAILGLGQARLQPTVRGDLERLDEAKTEIRLILPILVAFDHRVIDGADAAKFINDLAVLLSDPERLALDI